MRLQRVPRYVRHIDLRPKTSGRNVRPLLIINPRGDPAFTELVAELTAEQATDPAHLQASLRERYPDAIVRRRELSSESTDVWYVYRDGRWTPD